MSSITLRTEPETFQAVCEQCGWHTVPMVNRKRIEHYGEQHEKACPNPLPPRNGATMECGCWWYALPGSAAYETRAVCPVHGDTLMVAANRPCPQPDPGGHWVSGELGVDQP